MNARVTYVGEDYCTLTISGDNTTIELNVSHLAGDRILNMELQEVMNGNPNRTE